MLGLPARKPQTVFSEQTVKDRVLAESTRYSRMLTPGMPSRLGSLLGTSRVKMNTRRLTRVNQSAYPASYLETELLLRVACLLPRTGNEENEEC